MLYKFALFCLLLVAPPAFAEMFVWHDESGVKHVSTVPPGCIVDTREGAYLDRNCSQFILVGNPRARPAAKVVLQDRAGLKASQPKSEPDLETKLNWDRGR